MSRFFLEAIMECCEAKSNFGQTTRLSLSFGFSRGHFVNPLLIVFQIPHHGKKRLGWKWQLSRFIL